MIFGGIWDICDIRRGSRFRDEMTHEASPEQVTTMSMPPTEQSPRRSRAMLFLRRLGNSPAVLWYGVGRGKQQHGLDM